MTIANISSTADVSSILNPVFIGTGSETFTPTKSGAIATVMHEMARAAIGAGRQATVIARRHESAEVYGDVSCRLFDYPRAPKSVLSLWLRRVERKTRGWTRLRQGEWMAGIARMLGEPSMQRRPWLISNEPELVVHLRRKHPDAFLVSWFHNQHEAKPACREQLGRCSDLVLAVSNFTRQWVADYYRLNPELVYTLHNAIDTSVFAPAANESPAPPVIQFVGRTGIEKAPDLLIKACLKLSERTTDFRLRIVGSNYWGRHEEDVYQRELNALVDRLKKRGVAVEQTGHIDRHELPGLMATAHIHVTPSRWDEPFGLTTLEGMASGLATLAGDHGGSPEVLGGAGVLFRKDDPVDLANKLQPLVTDACARRAVARRCRERAESMTWDVAWLALSDLLKSKMKRNNPSLQ